MKKVLTMEEIQKKAPSVFAENPHSQVSDKYRFIPTTRVMEVLQSQGWYPVSASQSGTRKEHKKGYQKHMLKFEHESGLSIPDGDTSVNVQAVLINSHDRSSAYKLHLGAYRLICSNGMVVAIADMGEFSIKHIGYDDFDVMQASEKIIESAPVLTERINRFRSIELSDEQQIAFAEKAMQLRWPEEQLQKVSLAPEQILLARRHQDRGSDLWHTMNRIQENLVKGGLPYRNYENRRRNSTRAVGGISQDLSLNKGVWNLAEALAN